MNKTPLILKFFQKSDQLTVENTGYKKTISSFFQWLIDNDKVNNDKTTKFFHNLPAKAKIIAKQEGIVAGLEEVNFLLKKHTNLNFKPLLKDGNKFTNGTEIAQIKGKFHEILGYERTILNILQRMSGIATETNKLINLINQRPACAGRPTTNDQRPLIAATRKTPWMSLDKKAVAVGGGLTHRLNLSDGILVKDNHLAFVSIENALQILDDKYQNELIEVEVTNTKQAFNAISIFNKLNTNNYLAIMFDNFTPQMTKLTLNNLQKEFDISSIIFEASGGINKNNLSEWAKTGVDIISLGALTHSTHASNLSLEL